MATNILNDRKIKNAKPSEKEYFLSDGDGLSLRVRPAGDKLWILRYTNLSGRQSKKSLGPYPNVTLSQARQSAQTFKEGLAQGVDPKSLQKDVPVTVNDLFQIWITEELPRRRIERGVYQARLRLEKHLIPFVGKSAISSISRSNLLEIFGRLVTQGFNAQANVLLRDVSQMFDYAVSHEWLEFNRAKSIRNSEVGGKNKISTRYLTPNEITDLWKRCNKNTGITIQCHASIWLGLSTLARIEEMLTAEEQDFDLENNLWIIPAHKNKSSREHTIHLSPFSRKFIDMLWGIPRQGSSYLFKSNRTESFTKPKTLNFQISQRQDGLTVDDQNSRLSNEVKSSLRLQGGRWSHHDLRRTGATLMGSLGVQTEIIEKCLNHAVKNTLIRTYQKHENMEEREQAFLALGSELEKLTQH